jgi:hypothetical protein
MSLYYSILNRQVNSEFGRKTRLSARLMVTRCGGSRLTFLNIAMSGVSREAGVESGQII